MYSNRLEHGFLFNMYTIPFQTIDWSSIPKIHHAGETGEAYWQEVQIAGLRVRIVEYSSGYLADHWCEKGHIIYCLEGSFETELRNGERFTLTKGMSYFVSDGMSSHRSYSAEGVKLFIVDGNFLTGDSSSA
jgi:hypothetical protein